MKPTRSPKFCRDILMTCNHFNTIPAHLLNVIRFRSPSGHDDNQFSDAQVRNECQSNPITSDQKQCSEDFLFLAELNELSRYVIVHQIRYVTKIDVLEVIRDRNSRKPFPLEKIEQFFQAQEIRAELIYRILYSSLQYTLSLMFFIYICRNLNSYIHK